MSFIEESSEMKIDSSNIDSFFPLNKLYKGEIFVLNNTYKYHSRSIRKHHDEERPNRELHQTLARIFLYTPKRKKNIMKQSQLDL